MKIRVGKQPGHLADETIQKRIDIFARGVECRLKYAPHALDLKRPRGTGKFGISDQPTGGVAWNIELGHDSDATFRSISHNLAHFGLRIKLAVGTQLLEFRKSLALYPKALVIGKVPVKHIQLGRSHRVDIPLNYG